MKAECIVQYKQLEGILDKGDIVEIETILSDKDMVISWKFVRDPEGSWIRNRNGFKEVLDRNAKGVRHIRVTDLVQPKGTFIDYKFKSKNGHYYTGTGITNRIGMKHLCEILKEI